VTEPTRRVVLDAYAAGSCPVKIQNRYDPAIEAPGEGASDALLEVFAGGKAFEYEVLSELIRVCDDVADLRSAGRPQWDLLQARTTEAVAAGTSVILGAALPIDLAGHRRGQADILIRDEQRPDGRPGYLPVEVKRHRVIERQGPRGTRAGRFSRLAEPVHASGFDSLDWVFKTSRERDLLQMSQYWRLLEAAGWSAGGEPRGGVIGTDTIPDLGQEWLVTWVRLEEKLVRTFSRTSEQGWRLRSPLERYDHEHGFRVSVAQRALSSTQDPSAAPMVTPIRIRECDRCEWWQRCLPQFHEEDLSLRIDKSPLDVREISALRRFGITTITDLCAADLDGLMADYLPEVKHRDGAESRLRLAARRARLMAAGTELEKVTEDPIEVPGGSLEIDLDLETSADGRVYLWGFCVDDLSGADPEFVSFGVFSDLGFAAEIALMRRALTWLDGLIAEHGDLRIFHYSDFETVNIRRLAGRSGDRELRRLAARVIEHCVDLFPLVRQNFFAVRGLGLKVVATVGAGHTWRDEDPGGLNSQRWFDEAVTAEDPDVRAAAAQRVLDYNEDDVRATHALRGWLRAGAPL